MLNAYRAANFGRDESDRKFSNLGTKYNLQMKPNEMNSPDFEG